MIGKLKGIIDSIQEDHVILDVGGVGYVVFASPRNLAGLIPGDAAALIIETHVREDHIHLYGFQDGIERFWFRTLISVQRVSARMALIILDALPPESLMTALAARDTTAFSRINGIGKKLAERIIAELKDKVPAIPVSHGSASATAHYAPAMPVHGEVISALIHLGYSRIEAERAASHADASAPLDAQLKTCLKELA